MYNKKQYQKYNDKKILHKVKKQWVTISLALFMMLGGGAIATHVNANADTSNNNAKSIINVSQKDRMSNKASQASCLEDIQSKAKNLHTNLIRLGSKNKKSIQTDKYNKDSLNNKNSNTVNKINNRETQSFNPNNSKTNQPKAKTLHTNLLRLGSTRGYQSIQTGEYDGMSYRYNPDKKSLDFTGGIMKNMNKHSINILHNFHKPVTSVKFGKVNTNRVHNMAFLFNEANLRSIYLSKYFNTKQVYNMYAMFGHNIHLHNVHLSKNFNTEKAYHYKDKKNEDASGLLNMFGEDTAEVRHLYIGSPKTRLNESADLNSVSDNNIDSTGPWINLKNHHKSSDLLNGKSHVGYWEPLWLYDKERASKHRHHHVTKRHTFKHHIRHHRGRKLNKRIYPERHSQHHYQQRQELPESNPKHKQVRRRNHRHYQSSKVRHRHLRLKRRIHRSNHKRYQSSKIKRRHSKLRSHIRRHTHKHYRHASVRRHHYKMPRLRSYTSGAKIYNYVVSHINRGSYKGHREIPSHRMYDLAQMMASTHPTYNSDMTSDHLPHNQQVSNTEKIIAVEKRMGLLRKGAHVSNGSDINIGLGKSNHINQDNNYSVSDTTIGYNGSDSPSDTKTKGYLDTSSADPTGTFSRDWSYDPNASDVTNIAGMTKSQYNLYKKNIGALCTSVNLWHINFPSDNDTKDRRNLGRYFARRLSRKSSAVKKSDGADTETVGYDKYMGVAVKPVKDGLNAVIIDTSLPSRLIKHLHGSNKVSISPKLFKHKHARKGHMVTYRQVMHHSKPVSKARKAEFDVFNTSFGASKLSNEFDIHGDVNRFINMAFGSDRSIDKHRARIISGSNGKWFKSKVRRHLVAHDSASNLTNGWTVLKNRHNPNSRALLIIPRASIESGKLAALQFFIGATGGLSHLYKEFHMTKAFKFLYHYHMSRVGKAAKHARHAGKIAKFMGKTVGKAKNITTETKKILKHSLDVKVGLGTSRRLSKATKYINIFSGLLGRHNNKVSKVLGKSFSKKHPYSKFILEPGLCVKDLRKEAHKLMRKKRIRDSRIFYVLPESKPASAKIKGHNDML